MASSVFAPLPLLLALAALGCGPSEQPAVAVGAVQAAGPSPAVEVAEPLPAVHARPLTDRTFERTDARLARGRYLAEGILACFVCHSPRDESKPGGPPIDAMRGGGRVIYEEGPYRLVAPNISPDLATGAGTWTDDMLARAIREGVGHDGRGLSLPMYWESFRGLCDEDLASVVVFLRSIPPVVRALPSRALPREWEESLAREARPLTEPVPAPDFDQPLSRGRYLIGVADCIGCHTGWEAPVNPGPFAGGNMFDDETHFVTVNITPDPSGIGGWDDKTFIEVIRTGKNGALHRAMPWVAYRNLTDEDLAAIFLALRQLRPVRHWTNNLVEPTDCATCGQKHGLGAANEPIRVEPVDLDAAARARLRDLAGTYEHAEYGTIEISVSADRTRLVARSVEDGEDDETFEPVPQANGEFFAAGMFAPIVFERDGEDRVTALVFRTGLGDDDRYVKLP